MLRKLTRKIGFDLGKLPLSIRKYGNTSSASIPLTICSELTKEKPKDVLLVGMGAGLATGVAKINISEVINLGVLSLDL